MKETAQMIFLIAKREQKDNKRELMLRGKKKSQTARDKKQNLIESLPNIGPNLAKKLLEKFGSISKLISASEKEIAKVDGVGDKRASEIKKLFEEKF